MATGAPKWKPMGLAAGTFAALAIVWPAMAQEFDRGEALYENHCRSCHEAFVHERSRARVTSKSELRQRVAGWSIHIGLDWSYEEINDVTNYLNRRFYKFEDEPQS